MRGRSDDSSNVKYNRLPSNDSGLVDESFAIDFSSPFTYRSVYTYSKSVPPFVAQERVYNPPVVIKLCSSLLVFFSYLILFVTFPISGWLAVKFVQQFERVVVFRLGRIQKPKGPGVILVIPVIDRWTKVDMRVRAFNVPPQQFVTTDGTAINIGATVYFRVTDAILSVASIQDMNHSIRVLGQSVMMNLLCSKSKSDIDNDRAYLCNYMQEEMNSATQTWGVEISRVELSDVTVIHEAPDQSVNKVTGILGQLASQLGGGNTSLPSLLSPRLIPPLETAKVPACNSQVPISDISPEQLIESVKHVIDIQLVREVGAVYQFNILTTKIEVYYLDLKIGCGEAGSGRPPYCQPDCVLTISLSDLQALFSGELRPYAAYMSGRLKIDGDTRTAMKLEEVVNKLQGQ